MLANASTHRGAKPELPVLARTWVLAFASMTREEVKGYERRHPRPCGDND